MGMLILSINISVMYLFIAKSYIYIYLYMGVHIHIYVYIIYKHLPTFRDFDKLEKCSKLCISLIIYLLHFLK